MIFPAFFFCFSTVSQPQIIKTFKKLPYRRSIFLQYKVRAENESATRSHLDNRISNHLNTFLTGPSEQGQATLEDAPRPPVDAKSVSKQKHSFLFGFDHWHIYQRRPIKVPSGSIRPQNSLWQAVSQRLPPGTMILPSSPSPRWNGDQARRAAASDPRGGETPMTRLSQLRFRSVALWSRCHQHRLLRLGEKCRIQAQIRPQRP